MAIETFNPPVQPSPGTGFKPRVSLLIAEFGDGYTQAAPDGINHIKETISLTWDALTPDQQAEIYAFFKAKGGYIPFFYTPVGETDPMRFVCREWSKSAKSPWTVSATFEQDFSNAT